MSIAETAELAVLLKLGTTGSFKGATSELAGVERAAMGGSRSTGILSGALGAAGRASGRFSGALGHAKHSISEVLTGPLGVLGLAGGVGGLGIAFEKVITHTNDFAFSVEKLTGLTGDSAEHMSTLLAVFEKYNISAERTGMIVGFAEKTLGKLNETQGRAAKSTKLLALEQEKLNIQRHNGSTKAINLAIAEQKAADALKVGAAGVSKLVQLDKLYGITLVDNKGKAVDFQTELLRVADYYNSNRSASQKAALAAALFGRGYADLVPILKLGSKGILDAEAAATELGLTLTAQNARDLKDYRESLRETADAVGGLELQIGLALVPAIKDMADGITSFLKHGGREQLVGFFKQSIAAAREFAGFVTGTLVPVLGSIAGAAKTAWDSIPAPIRDLLVKGYVANRAVKFLFGFSPITFAKDALGELFKKGGSPANPLWVAQVGGGLGGGGGIPGLAAGTAEGAGAVGVGEAAAGLGLGTIAIGVAAGTAIAALGIMGLGWLITATSSPEALAAANQNASDAERFKRSGGKVASGIYAGSTGGSSLEDRDLRDLNRAMTGTENHTGKMADDIGPLSGSMRDLRASFHADLWTLIHATKALDVQKAAKKIGDEIAKGIGNKANTEKTLGALKTQLLHTDDPQTRAVLKQQIARVERVLPDRRYAAQQYAAVNKILADGKITASESKQLHRIMGAVKDHGLPAVSKGIQAKIDAAKAAQKASDLAIKLGITAVKTAVGVDTQAIKDKDLSVTVNTTTNVSVRDLAKVTFRVNSFGRKIS